MKSEIIAFIVSSSVLVFIFTYLYLIITYKSNTNNKIAIENLLFPIPILYGIFGTINYIIIRKFDCDNYSLLVGGLFGLILSIIGRFIFDLPNKLFNIKKEKEYIVHIVAFVSYALIFRIILTPLLHYVIDT